MSEGSVTINATQALAVVRLIRDEIGLDDNIVVHIEHEYAVGAGNLLKVYEPSDKLGVGKLARTWLIGRDGGVIEL